MLPSKAPEAPGPCCWRLAGLPTATATDEKMCFKQRNPALLSHRPVVVPISPSRCFAPGVAFGISAEPSCQNLPPWADVFSGCPEDLDAESGDEKQRLLVKSSQHPPCFLWVKYGQISFGSFLVLPFYGYPPFDPYRQRFSEQSGLFIFIYCSIHEEMMI